MSNEDTKDCTWLPVFLPTHDVHGAFMRPVPATSTGYVRYTDAQDLIAELSENAPWLASAHRLCADAGITPGAIGERLEELRDVIAELRAENENLRSSMKGDYDLDAWLGWAKEAKALRDGNEDLAAHLHDTEERCKNASRNASAFEARMGELQVENGKLHARIAKLQAAPAPVPSTADHIADAGEMVEPAAAVYQCPRCGTGMQVDPSAKPAPVDSDVREVKR